MREHLCFCYCNFFYLTIQCNCSACNVPPDAGLQKRAHFSTLIVGLSGTGNQTQSPCAVGSGVDRSAIHDDYGSLFRVAILHRDILYKVKTGLSLFSAISDVISCYCLISRRPRGISSWSSKGKLFKNARSFSQLQRKFCVVH
jgi:hypothetical protein